MIECPKALDKIPRGEEDYTVFCEATNKFCKVRLYRACTLRFDYLKNNYGVDLLARVEEEESIKRVGQTDNKEVKVRGRR